MSKKILPSEVSDHYTVTDLGGRILTLLEEAGKNIENLSIEDLAPVDAFHIRGRGATEELTRWAQVKSSDLVLDVGSGLGGTSRYLASITDCNVVGIDLTDDYCRVASMLSEKVGLGDKTRFLQGSALELPFDDSHFDVAWTEHVQMNIVDKKQFYGELSRVLKPGGRLAFHDIFAGNGKELDYPVPWASDASISHLMSVPALKDLLATQGLVPLRWEDKTAASIAFFQSALQQTKTGDAPPLGLHVLMGETARSKFTNVLRNLETGRLSVIQAVMRA